MDYQPVQCPNCGGDNLGEYQRFSYRKRELEVTTSCDTCTWFTTMLFSLVRMVQGTREEGVVQDGEEAERVVEDGPQGIIITLKPMEEMGDQKL